MPHATQCCGRKGHFPEAEHDPVIQISNVVTVQGVTQPLTQNVFTLGTCLPIAGAQVISSQHEHELLMRWAEFVREVDPDVITGYNTQNFDVPYLLNRGKALKKTKACQRNAAFESFFCWGRMRGAAARMRDTTFQSAAFGKRENIETTVDGRVMFDLLPYMFRNHKMSSYSLNSVSAEFLGSQKEDVHHSIIADLQNGSDADRRRLAVYCLKDSQLVGQLMTKLSVLVNYIEMARVTGVSVDFLLSRGQQIKVLGTSLSLPLSPSLGIRCATPSRTARTARTASGLWSLSRTTNKSRLCLCHRFPHRCPVPVAGSGVV